MFIYNVPDQENFYSFDFLNFENGSFILTHTALLNSRNYKDAVFKEKNFIAFYVYANSSWKFTQRPLNLNLREYKGFLLFWKQVGIIIFPVIAFLALVYVIFRKKINKTFLSLKTYFSRPVKSTTSKITLFFTNLWIFFTNSLSTLYILFKTNKKRHLMNLIGMSILAVIIITSANLYTSKQKVLFSEYVDKIDVLNDSIPSLSITMSYDTSGTGISLPIEEEFNELALSEIFTQFKLEYKTFGSIISNIEYSTFMYMTAMDFLDNSSFQQVTYITASENYTSVIEAMLVEGRLPTNKGEVLLSTDVVTNLNVTLNETIRLYGSTRSYYNFELGETYALVKVVGTFQPLSTEELKNLVKLYNLPYDAVKSLDFLFGGVFAFNKFALKNLHGIYPWQMVMTTYVQFYYDFSDFDPTLLSVLKEEQQALIDGNEHPLNFSPFASWSISAELDTVITTLEPKLKSSIFLFFTLAIPIIYLSIFLILETNEIYSRSMEQEIEIFQIKGISTSRIALNYSIIKFFEASVAAIIGFLLSLALTPPLLKMDSFVSFNNPFFYIDFTSIPLSAVLTIVLIVLISLPMIIKMSKQTTIYQKTPNRLLSLLKKIRIIPLLLIILGGGIIFGGLMLYNLFASTPGVSTPLVMVFIYISGSGLLVGLLGIGLLLKDFHSILMIAISKISWKVKKSIGTFSLIDIRADVKLFNNIFLTFFILIGVTLPSIIAPLSVQYNFQKDAYLYAGSDIYVKNWLDYNSSDFLPNITAISGIHSVTTISAVDANLEGSQLYIYLIYNITTYLETSYKPPKRMFSQWDTAILSLQDNNTMLCTQYFFEGLAHKEYSYTFSNQLGTINEEYTIIRQFDYFPVFYFLGPYKKGATRSVNALVMTDDNFRRIIDTVTVIGGEESRFDDRLLIKLEPDADEQLIAKKIRELGLEIIVAKEDAEQTQFESFPFYSIVAAEFTISILICLIAIAFISITNPIKLLQKRTNKNDRLKKMGISTKKIIQLTALETFVSGVLPGILLGTGFAFAIITGFILATKAFFYGGIKYLVVLSPMALIIAYVLTPILFYSIFYLSMKRNYARYLPRNLE